MNMSFFCAIRTCHHNWTMTLPDGRMVCDDHGMPKVVEDKDITFRCKHCKVRVLGRLDFRAILGSEHAKSCPRRRWNAKTKP